LKYGGADFLQNHRIFSLQNGPRMRAIVPVVLVQKYLLHPVQYLYCNLPLKINLFFVFLIGKQANGERGAHGAAEYSQRGKVQEN
jgi:hypothetical protein